jgi:hypothetical protein
MADDDGHRIVQPGTQLSFQLGREQLDARVGNGALVRLGQTSGGMKAHERLARPSRPAHEQHRAVSTVHARHLSQPAAEHKVQTTIVQAHDLDHAAS